MKALLVRGDGTREVIETDGDLNALQALVGGMIEMVYVDAEVHAYCNEEGKILGLPVNEEATALVPHMGGGWDVLCGDVVFLGSTGADEADVPARWLDFIGVSA